MNLVPKIVTRQVCTFCLSRNYGLHKYKKNVFKKKLLCCICQFKNSLFGAYKATLQHDFKRQYHITKKVKLIYKIIDLDVKRSFMKGMRIKYRLHLTAIKIL